MEAPLHVAASSLLEHADGPVDFFFLLSEFRVADCDRLRATLAMRNKPHTATFLSSDARMQELRPLLPLHGAVSPYLRFLLPELVGRDRMLYLDADTVCLADVTRLEALPMDATLGFVERGEAKHYPECRFFPSAGLSLDTPAFNSGVMLVDGERWRREQWTSRLIAFCREQRCHDQPGLIAVCNGAFTRLPESMNIHVYPTSTLEEQAGVFHFVGSPKPWDVAGRVFHDSFRLYARELVKTAAPRWSGLRVSTWKRAYHVKGGYYRTLRSRLRRAPQRVAE